MAFNAARYAVTKVSNSTDSEEQQTSYEAQVDYYTSYIQSREDWDFIGVYADEGKSYGLNPKSPQMPLSYIHGRFLAFLIKDRQNARYCFKKICRRVPVQHRMKVLIVIITEALVAGRRAFAFRANFISLADDALEHAFMNS